MSQTNKTRANIDFFKDRWLTVHNQEYIHIGLLADADHEVEILKQAIDIATDDNDRHLIELELDCLYIRIVGMETSAEVLRKKKDECFDELISEARA